MKQRLCLGFVAVSGFVGVSLGAITSHGLSGKLSEDALHLLTTGLEYQMIHTLALLGCIALAGQWRNQPGLQTILNFVCLAFMSGIVLFSGSLYAIALSGDLSSKHGLGVLTPIGGLFFLSGWLGLAIAAVRR